MDIQLQTLSRHESIRTFDIPSPGWQLARDTNRLKKFRFYGTSDDVCLQQDEVALVEIEFGFELPKEALDSSDLVKESDEPLTQMMLKTMLQNPSSLSLSAMLQERMLQSYAKIPAKESYLVRWKVSADGFQESIGEAKILIEWVRGDIQIIVE